MTSSNTATLNSSSSCSGVLHSFRGKRYIPLTTPCHTPLQAANRACLALATALLCLCNNTEAQVLGTVSLSCRNHQAKHLGLHSQAPQSFTCKQCVVQTAYPSIRDPTAKLTLRCTPAPSLPPLLTLLLPEAAVATLPPLLNGLLPSVLCMSTAA